MFLLVILNTFRMGSDFCCFRSWQLRSSFTLIICTTVEFNYFEWTPPLNQPSVLITLPKMNLSENAYKPYLEMSQICNASFATRDRLRSHLACHEDKIPCQVCGKFLRAAYMTDHLKKHSEGPHNYCGICNKGTGHSLKITHFIKALPINTADLVLTKYPANDPCFHCHWHHP